MLNPSPSGPRSSITVRVWSCGPTLLLLEQRGRICIPHRLGIAWTLTHQLQHFKLRMATVVILLCVCQYNLFHQQKLLSTAFHVSYWLFTILCEVCGFCSGISKIQASGIWSNAVWWIVLERNVLPELQCFTSQSTSCNICFTFPVSYLHTNKDKFTSKPTKINLFGCCNTCNIATWARHPLLFGYWHHSPNARDVEYSDLWLMHPM
jgi:hypothetical protein